MRVVFYELELFLKNRKFLLFKVILPLDSMGKYPKQQRLKICIVGPSKRFLSGISYYTIMLANALSKEHDVSVVLFRKMVPEFIFPGRKRIGKNLTTLTFADNVKVFDGVDYTSLSTWLSAAKFVKKNQPDVVILQWWTSSVAHMELVLKILFKIGNVPVHVLEMHEIIDTAEEESFLLHFYSTVMMKLLKSNTKGFITHSESDKSAIATRYKIRKNLINVIPHGPYNQYNKINREDSIEKLKLNPKNFNILYFGLIRHYKGLKYLIEAFNQLPAKIANNCNLLIVGELWEDGEEIDEAIRTSRYNKNIISRFEYVPDNAVSLYFSACDVLVLPYLRASQSGVAHIAITFGKPIIVTKVGGLERSMKDYEGTIFVEPANSDQIMNNIIMLFNNQETKKEFKSTLTWKEIIIKYANMIRIIRGDNPLAE